MPSSELDIVARYSRPHEPVQGVFPGFTGWSWQWSDAGGGLGWHRRVLGVTDQRVIFIKSGYLSLSDRGLLWADPLHEVALASRYQRKDNGRLCVGVRRADGSTMLFNPSSGTGSWSGAEERVARLYSLIPGRYGS